MNKEEKNSALAALEALIRDGNFNLQAKSEKIVHSYLGSFKPADPEKIAEDLLQTAKEKVLTYIQNGRSKSLENIFNQAHKESTADINEQKVRLFGFISRTIEREAGVRKSRWSDGKARARDDISNASANTIEQITGSKMITSSSEQVISISQLNELITNTVGDERSSMIIDRVEGMKFSEIAEKYERKSAEACRKEISRSMKIVQQALTDQYSINPLEGLFERNSTDVLFEKNETSLE